MKLSELLQALISEQGIQVTELSRRADVNRSYIYRKLHGDDENLDRVFDILTGDIQPDELIAALNLIRSIKINQQPFPPDIFDYLIDNGICTEEQASSFADRWFQYSRQLLNEKAATI